MNDPWVLLIIPVAWIYGVYLYKQGYKNGVRDTLRRQYLKMLKEE